LIGMEEVSDRRRVLRKALDHAFHPGTHAFSFHQTTAPDAALEL
jgi:hypothetical protein